MAQISYKPQPTLEEVKQEKIKQVKQQAYSILLKTDWYVIRHQETGEAIPQEVLDERASIRQQSDTMESEINALTTIEEVQNYEIVFN